MNIKTQKDNFKLNFKLIHLFKDCYFTKNSLHFLLNFTASRLAKKVFKKLFKNLHKISL